MSTCNGPMKWKVKNKIVSELPLSPPSPEVPTVEGRYKEVKPHSKEKAAYLPPQTQWKSKDGSQKDLTRTSSGGRGVWRAKSAVTGDAQSDDAPVLNDLVVTCPESQPAENCEDVLATWLRPQEKPQQSAEHVADELGAVLRHMGWPSQPTELVYTWLRSQLVPEDNPSVKDSGLVWVKRQSPKPAQHHSVSEEDQKRRPEAWERKQELQAPISSSQDPCKFTEGETTTSENSKKARVSKQQGRSRRKNEGDGIWVKRSSPMPFQNRSAPEQTLIPEVWEWEQDLSEPAPISSSKEPCRSTKESKSGVEACLENHPDRVVAGSAGLMKARASEQQRRSRRKNGGDRVRVAWQPTLRSSSGTSEIPTQRVHPGDESGKPRIFTLNDTQGEQGQGPLAVQTTQVQQPSPGDWRPTLRHWTT